MAGASISQRLLTESALGQQIIWQCLSIIDAALLVAFRVLTACMCNAVVADTIIGGLFQAGVSCRPSTATAGTSGATRTARYEALD